MNSVQYLLDLAIILFSAKVFSVAGKKLGIPEVVGEILAGLVVGSAVLGVVKETEFLSITANICGLGSSVQHSRQ